jgi:hypothetical protein
MALTQAEFAGRMLNDAGEALASKNVCRSFSLITSMP